MALGFEKGRLARVMSDDRESLQHLVGEVGEVTRLSYAPGGRLETVTLRVAGESVAYWPSELEVLGR